MEETALLSVAADVAQHAVMVALLLVQEVRQIPHALDALQHVKEDVIHLALQPAKVLLQTAGVQIVQIVVLPDVQELVQEGVVLVVQKNAAHHVHLLVQVVADRDVLVDVVVVADRDVPADVPATVILVVLVDVVVHAQVDVHLLVLVAQEHVLEHVSFIATQHVKAVVIQLVQHIVGGLPVWALVWVHVEVG